MANCLALLIALPTILHSSTTAETTQVNKSTTQVKNVTDPALEGLRLSAARYARCWLAVVVAAQPIRLLSSCYRTEAARPVAIFGPNPQIALPIFVKNQIKKTQYRNLNLATSKIAMSL